MCYVGLAYRLTEDGRNACCAAQLFLDSGDGVVFVGDFGPWYSEERGEFHLPPDKAEALLRGTIATYQEQDGRPLKEIFLHARSGIDATEFSGFERACPPGVKLVAIRVRQDRGGLRHFSIRRPSERRKARPASGSAGRVLATLRTARAPIH